MDTAATYSRPLQIPSNLITTNALDQTKTATLTTETGSITLQPNKESTITVEIPASTTVKAAIEWDGKITPPIVESVTKVSATGDEIVGSTDKLVRDDVVAVVKIGSDKARLDFSNKVTLSIPVDGLADGAKVAIYSSDSGHQWTYEGDGVVKDGKVVFETTHFTYFALKSKAGAVTSATTPVEQVAGQATQFTDIAGHWAESYINELAAKGIVTGKGNGLFAPEDNITRAEFTKIAVMAFGIEVPETVDSAPFADVSTDAWYAPYVAAAKEAGIVDTNAANFNPNAAITRAEALKILIGAAGFTDVDSNFEANYTSNEGWTYVGFTDVPIAGWFSKFVGYAKDFGIVDGYPDGLFHPEKPMTRAEVAKVVLKVMDQQAK